MPGWEGSTRKQRLPHDWQARRRRVLERDGYRCTRVESGRRCPAVATDCHHVDDDDDHSETNLASLCGWHHACESSKQGGVARGKKYSEKREPERHPGLR